MLAVCPCCDKPMLVFINDDIQLDVCGDCGGMWLDEGEFSELSDAAAQPDMPTDSLLAELMVKGHKPPGKARLCPRCMGELEEITLPALDHCSPTHLDRCTQNHGLFFDRNELAQVLCRHHSPDSPLSMALASFFGPDYIQFSPSNEVPHSSQPEVPQS